MKSSLHSITQILLADQSEPGDLYRGAHELHDIFANATGLAAGNITDQPVYLPSGKAVSPIVAAHCLLEFKRTTVFLRGIYKAIKHLQNVFKGERINILYAGCGPYGTLLTPLTSMFTATEIGIVLMDINQDALTHVTKLYNDYGLNDYIIRIIQADAAVYQIDPADRIHMAVSETMQNALRREPQVAIMLNLIPQLQQEAVFIPEEITISAVLISSREETQSFMETGLQPARHYLGEVYTISRSKTRRHEAITFKIPPNTDQFSDLRLFTDIKVFESEILTAYDCGLNLPMKVCDVVTISGKKISFEYKMTEDPAFVYEVS